jgi:ferredoxin--NADP+ reductase
MHLDELDLDPRFTATVVHSERITPAQSSDEVRELVLDVAAPQWSLEIGQSIAVIAPGQEAFGQKDHVRLYSVADLPQRSEAGQPRIKIAVKRCDYVDDYSGERYPGIASNYLCNLRPGDALTVAGPFGLPFEVPSEQDANLILIATSTGVAPFRAFVRHLYEHADFTGLVRLFYGARSGLDTVYLNDERDDFAQYYDRNTFEAFKALSPRPHWGDAIDWGQTIHARAEELVRMLGEPKTYVYVAGLATIREALDEVLGELLGAKAAWTRKKAEMVATRRWVELLY